MNQLTVTRYQEQKQKRIEQAISSLTIESDPWALFAVVPSTTKKLTVYIVIIEDGKATSCTCPGHAEHHKYCIHQIATQNYIDTLVEDATDVETQVAAESVVAELPLSKWSKAEQASMAKRGGILMPPPLSATPTPRNIDMACFMRR